MVFKKSPLRVLHFFRLSIPVMLLVLALPAMLQAQQRCGTVEYMRTLSGGNSSDAKFESWMAERLQARSGVAGQQRTQSTYKIPVVVHVIHNGESVGTGTNIPDAQVLSQIRVLNADYQRLNADRTNTPAEFQSVAGNLNIEFVLARRDPEGQATTGIVRVKGTQTSWTSADGYKLKALSYWPAEDYLNLWVCSESDYLGYAQFPVSSLAGLEDASNNRLTDGVVIDYKCFGSIEDGAFSLDGNYNKGRTATHEIGHYLGLRHIWGDDGSDCAGTDYVDDTPNQSGYTSGCPSHPRVTCSVNSMFQNYMDYSNDACMNMFTAQQVARMTTVLDNSIRRKTLTSSVGLLDPEKLPNDLGIRSVIAPAVSTCGTSFTPQIELRNYGNNTITAATIQFKLDGTPVETKSFTLNLGDLETTQVTFSPVSTTAASHSATFTIINTNGTTDGASNNNTLVQDFIIPQKISVPFTETFNSFPSNWILQNPDGGKTWTIANTGTGPAIKMDFFNYPDREGETDVLLTPVMDLTAVPAALLVFDVAYARYQSSSNDGLRVVVLTGCSSDLSNGTEIYYKSGSTLQTLTTAVSTTFTPASASQWRTEAINLQDFIGLSEVQLAFISINDYGNNLYLDNIQMKTSNFDDIRLKELARPAAVTCVETQAPRLTLTNTGTSVVNTVQIAYAVNGKDNTSTFTNLNLGMGETTTVVLPAVKLNSGNNTLSFNVTLSGGLVDSNPNDNTLTTIVALNKSTDVIPLRENFEADVSSTWATVSPTGGTTWAWSKLTGNAAYTFKGYNTTSIGQAAWLATPVLDFSGAESASMAFDLSYAFRPGSGDRLDILASTDCGVTYSQTVFSATGTAIGSRTQDEAWSPSADSDWTRQFITLNALAGEENVRLAFVFTPSNGNNIFLDNIEFFVSDQQYPAVTESGMAVYPNPMVTDEVTVAFNLPERADVQLDVINSLGKTLLSTGLSRVLNQTEQIALPDLQAGTYVVRVTTPQAVYWRKLVKIR